jgi:hypothetical protein
MRRAGSGLGNERGSTLVLMSVMLFAMLALAIDLASLRDARSETQRVADAVALAGATAFRDYPWEDGKTVDSAGKWAIDIARQNQVRSDTVDVRNETSQTTTYPWGKVRVVQTNQVTLNVIPDSQKVRAWVRHAGVPTFFGGLLAKPYGHVQAMATAWATNAGPTVNCLKPFVIPDMWNESDPLQDIDGDDYMDPILTNPGPGQDGESWKYEPASVGGNDYYLPFDEAAPPDPLGRPQTGYGSPLRSAQGYERDVGLPLLLKPQTGGGNTKPAPERMGNAFWILDYDPDANTREEIEGGCATASIGDPVPYDNGSKTGPIRQGINTLVQRDPSAVWNQSTKQVENSVYDDWTESPRVVLIGLIDPIYWTAASNNAKPDPGSVFTNFARMFLLPNDPKGPPDNVHAIFIGPAPGGHGGPTGGTLVKTLQLIE